MPCGGGEFTAMINYETERRSRYETEVEKSQWFPGEGAGGKKGVLVLLASIRYEKAMA